MPRTITIESPQEFINRNGGTSIASSSGSWLLCPNGAKLTNNGNQRHEPPEDPVKRLEAELDYLEALVKKLEQQYVQIQNNLIQQTNWYIMGAANMPDEGGLKALSEVKALLAKKTRERDEKKLSYETARGPTRAEIQAQEQSERREEARNFLNKLEQITNRNLDQEHDEKMEIMSKFVEKSDKIFHQAADKLEEQTTQNLINRRR